MYVPDDPCVFAVEFWATDLGWRHESNLACRCRRHNTDWRSSEGCPDCGSTLSRHWYKLDRKPGTFLMIVVSLTPPVLSDDGERQWHEACLDEEMVT